MYCSKSLAFIGLAVAAPAVAFVSPSRGLATQLCGVPLRATRDPNDDQSVTHTPDAIRNLAAVSALSLGLLFPSTNAFAAPIATSQLPSDHALHSSTVELSVEIKTMDFSMPSSYDAIAAPVAAGTSELSQDLVKKPTPKAAPKKAAAPKKTKEASDGGGGFDMPSISNPFAGGGDSSGPSSKEKAAAKVAAKKAQREAEEAEKKEADRAAALKLQEEIKEAREARMAAKAAERAAEEAAAAEKAAAAEAK